MHENEARLGMSSAYKTTLKNGITSKCLIVKLINLWHSICRVYGWRPG